MTESRQQFAPIGVRAPWSKTTERLHKKFGWPGVLVWHYMILAAKRSYVPGQLTFGGDTDFWTLLGMEHDPPDLAVADLLRELGHMKQTRRTRSGRLSYVSLTRFGDWNEKDKRWREAERKRLDRLAKAQENASNKAGQKTDTPRTAAGHEADAARTGPGHEADASAPLELQNEPILKDHSLVARGKADTPPPPTDDDIPFDFPDVLVKAMPD